MRISVDLWVFSRPLLITLGQWLSNLNLHQNRQESWENTDCWAPAPEFLIQWGWDGAGELCF